MGHHFSLLLYTSGHAYGYIHELYLTLAEGHGHGSVHDLHPAESAHPVHLQALLDSALDDHPGAGAALHVAHIHI